MLIRSLALLQCLHHVTLSLLLADEPPEDVGVLVFGDSWGALGPSYHMIEDMFKWKGVSATVRSTAVSGTRACQWSMNPANLPLAAGLLFPPKGPDFVWLSLGGNDLLDPSYLKCSRLARDLHEALACVQTITYQTNLCEFALLDKLYEAYPHTKVVQCGYDFQCGAGLCLPIERFPFCHESIVCANALGRAWERFLVEPVVERYVEAPGWFTAIDVDGAAQSAADMPGATAGRPLIEWSSPCYMMTACVHPTYGSLAAAKIGDAFWDHFFSKHVTPNMAPLPRPLLQRVRTEPAASRPQTDSTVADTYCNWDWVPSIASMTKAPCNRTADD